MASPTNGFSVWIVCSERTSESYDWDTTMRPHQFQLFDLCTGCQPGVELSVNWLYWYIWHSKVSNAPLHWSLVTSADSQRHQDAQSSFIERPGFCDSSHQNEFHAQELPRSRTDDLKQSARDTSTIVTSVVKVQKEIETVLFARDAIVQNLQNCRWDCFVNLLCYLKYSE